ncbi:MAG TPA: hypothetical protein PLC48_09245 [Ferruginibacter sp.]|nr:hypothetical protein [Ferruginibacter sp.]
MKKILFYVLVAFFATSCNNNDTDEDKTTPEMVAPVLTPDSASAKSDAHYFWESDIHPKQGLVMLKTRPIPADSLNANSIIEMMNGMYPEIKIEFQKISGDSIYIKIPKSNYLTRQMGSSGAESWLAEVTYNLTELGNIDYVDIRFREGDHATPGTYSRTDFVHSSQP